LQTNGQAKYSTDEHSLVVSIEIAYFTAFMSSNSSTISNSIFKTLIITQFITIP
jgi:hypothetical protein